LGGLWALEWAWDIAEINLRCVVITIVIPVTRGVKEYTRFFGKCVTGRGKPVRLFVSTLRSRKI